jgi:hypothetical protein
MNTIKFLPFIVLGAVLSFVSCQKENNNSNVEKLLFDQYKESEHFYQTNLNDFHIYIEQYISQNPTMGLYQSFDSIRRIKTIVDRTVVDIDKSEKKERQKLIDESRSEIDRLSSYKFDFIKLESLKGLNDSLYNQAIKTDLLKANYNIYLQYSHDKMKQ